jgi:hypothetical protein
VPFQGLETMGHSHHPYDRKGEGRWCITEHSAEFIIGQMLLLPSVKSKALIKIISLIFGTLAFSY